MAGKGIKKASKFVANSVVGEYVASSVKSVGKSIQKMATSKVFWGRAVRVMRSNTGTIGMIGKLGKGLSKAGGGLGWLGKGLGAFDIDFRSPKEFRKEQDNKREQLSRMKIARDRLIEKEIKAQKDLKDEVINISDIETSEEKLNELATHLQKMKVAVGNIQSTSTDAASRLKGFEEYQVKANNALGEAITTSDQTSLKATLKGIEEVKDSNAVAGLESTTTIISELSGKMDAMEEERQREAEERRKNDWKRKFFEGILFIADWVLNFWWKIGVIIAKLVAVLLLMFSGEIMKLYKSVSAVFTLGWKTIIKVLYWKITKFVYQAISKVLKAINWLLARISHLFNEVKHWLIQSIFDLISPILDMFNLTEDGQKVLDQWKKDDQKGIDKMENAIDNFLGKFSDMVGDMSDEMTKADMAQAYKNIEVKEAKEQAQNVKDQKLKEEAAAEKAKNAVPIGTKIGNFLGDSLNKAEELGEKGKELAGKGKDKMAEIANSKIAKEISATATEVKSTISENVSIESIKDSSKEVLSDGIKAAKDATDNLANEMTNLKNAVNQSRSNSNSSAPQVKQGDKYLFEESSGQFQNQNQT